MELIKGNIKISIFIVIAVIIIIYTISSANNMSSTINNLKRREHLSYDIIKLQDFLNVTQKQSSTSFDTWLYIGNPSLRYQIYSAFFDNRPEIVSEHSTSNKLLYGTVRIIAVLPLNLKNTKKIVCNFKKIDSNENFTSNAVEVIPVSENFGFKFSAYILLCPLSLMENHTVLPESVSLTYYPEKSLELPNVFIPIRYPNLVNASITNKTLALCVGPIFKYADALRLVEFVEIYRSLGVDQFYFYNKSATPSIYKILNYYKELNLATIQEWNIDGYQFEVELRYGGIFAAFNDCLYRSMVTGYKFIGVLDLDEIFIPFHFETLVDFLTMSGDDKYYEYNFQSVFLSLSENSNVSLSDQIRNKFLYTQNFRERSQKPLPYHIRSKYIANVNNVIELGNHFVWRHVKGTVEKRMNPEDGLLFHYRNECVGPYCKESKYHDLTARRFFDLYYKVDTVCSEVFENGICPIENFTVA